MGTEVPYIYRKIIELLSNGKGTFKLPEMQDSLTKLRIEKREALTIAKELEKQGLIVLDISKGVNQHLKIRICSKGVAAFYTCSFVILLYCMVLMLYTGMFAVCV